MKGIGTDIVQIARIRDSYQKQGDRFLKRILSASEQEIFSQRRQSMTFLANRFAAKEAISKALGTGIAFGVTFVDIEVLPGLNGRPRVQLYNIAEQKLQELGGEQVHVTLSDERDYAVAFAVIT